MMMSVDDVLKRWYAELAPEMCYVLSVYAF